MTNSLLTVGKVSGYFGVKGWVKVFSYADPVDNIISYPEWIVDGKCLSKIKAQKHGKTVIAKFTQCNNREDAKLYIGKMIQVKSDQLKKLPEKEFYWHQLIGLTVIDQNDCELGKISDILPTGANDVLLVKGKSEMLIPYIVDQVVTDIDLENSCMKVNWHEIE
ncbi:MAG: ribosome maturation factor RimM [Proteobacteria bacterium]|nr:ribosome maturation factor RimM [Pseudomonadota bacterium]